MKKQRNKNSRILFYLKKSLLLLTLILCQSVSANSFNNPQAWLKKLAQATSESNFTASFVLLKPNTDVEPYIWRHALVDGVEFEHLNMLNGPGREVVRVGPNISYFEPYTPPFTLQSSTINGPIPYQLIKHYESLVDTYNFVLVGRSRVSGRAAQQIRMVSHDKNLYAYNLWLDQASGLMLRLDTVDLNGQVVEQIQVTSLDITEQPDTYFSRIELSELPRVVEPSTEIDTTLGWQINWLPSGMKVIKKDIRRLSANDGVVEYMMLSDGMVDISVYLQQLSNGISQQTALKHQSNTLVTMQRDSLAVTIIGKLPAKTAGAIASSIGVIPQ
jgi:sigma-E factor negative regulatory protein RseB